MVHGLTVHREGPTGGGRGRGGGGDATRPRRLQLPRRPVVPSHTYMDPLPSSGRARNSFVAVPHRAGKAVKVKREECVQAALVGRQETRACCLPPGSPPPGGSSRGCKGIVSAALPCHHMPVDDEGRRGETARLTSRRGRLLSPPLRRVQSVRTASHHIPLCSLPRGSPAIASAQLLVPTPGRPTQGWKGIRMSVCPALVDIRAQAHRLLWRNAPHHRSQYWG